MTRHLIRTDPRLVRDVLAHVDRSSMAAAARAAGIHHKTVSRWVTRRAAEGQAWPTDEYIAEWVAADRDLAARRAKGRAWGKQYRDDTYLGRPGRKVDATGSARRLQALYALGWTSSQLAPRLGVSAARVGHLVNAMYPVLLRTTANRIAEVYAELSMVVPSDDETTRTPRAGRIHARQRRMAKARGWVPPLAWDDDTINDPAAKPASGCRTAATSTRYDVAVIGRVLAGEWHLNTSRPEREEIVRTWLATGRPVNDLARLTGWKPERYYDTTSEVA